MTAAEENVKRAREYLSQIGKADRLIGRLTETAADLRRSLTGQCYALNPNKVQTSGPKDRVGETTVKIVELEQQINERIDALVDLKQDILARIERIPDYTLQEILIARYVQGKRFKDFSDSMDLSTAMLYKIHRTALEAFAAKNQDVCSACCNTLEMSYSKL